MITTFILSNNILQKELLYKDLDIIEYPITDDIFENLKSAIDWANLNQEEIIYFISENDVEATFDLSLLENALNELVEQKIFGIYINVQADYSIQFTPYLELAFGISKIKSFILTKPIFNFIASILETRNNLPNITWNNFIQKFLPNNFIFHNKKYPLVQRNNNIYIISPFRNVENYINEYLESIRIQDYKNYQVTLIDDCSEDDSLSKIPDYQFITKIKNSKRKYALRNTVDALLSLNSVDDEDIICIIDGDDKLTNKYVFNILNAVYQDSNLLFTYGAMNYIGNNAKIGTAYNKSEYENLRTATWKISHLRTFRYKLFRKLIEVDPKLACLKDNSGNMLKMPADMALLFPLMELAGYMQTRYLDTPLYNYRVHEGNDQFVNAIEQYEGDIEIRNKVAFKPFY